MSNLRLSRPGVMREFAHEFVDEFFANFVHEFKYEFARIRLNILHEKLVMLRMACTIEEQNLCVMKLA